MWNKIAIIIIITPHHDDIVLYKISHFKDHDPQGYKKRFSRKRYCLLPLLRCKNILLLYLDGLDDSVLEGSIIIYYIERIIWGYIEFQHL